MSKSMARTVTTPTVRRVSSTRVAASMQQSPCSLAAAAPAASRLVHPTTAAPPATVDGSGQNNFTVYHIRQVNGVKLADILFSLLSVCVSVCEHPLLYPPSERSDLARYTVMV